ncbi:MAG: hypothetical protein JXB85_14535, partial [Anaerolineales bacterium]|nr:hypothetical protein [Anaerolineales bacterium]
GERKLLAEGYEFERLVKAEIGAEVKGWTERVVIVRSESYQRVMREGLERRLQRALEELLALNPCAWAWQTPVPG